MQVIGACTEARMSSNFGQFLPLTMELAALERLKNCCFHFFMVAVDKILFKLACNEDIHNIFQPGAIARSIAMSLGNQEAP